MHILISLQIFLINIHNYFFHRYKERNYCGEYSRKISMNESPPRRQKRNKNWCKPCTKTCNKTWKCVIRIVARRNGRNRQVSDGVHKSITPEWRVIISFSFFSFFFFRWWWLWWERLCEDLRLLQRTGVVQYFDLSVVVICVWPEGEEGVDAQTEVRKIQWK